LAHAPCPSPAAASDEVTEVTAPRHNHDYPLHVHIEARHPLADCTHPLYGAAIAVNPRDAHTDMAADFSEGRLETVVGSPQKELAGTQNAYVSYLVTTKVRLAC
jgi:hypothetical protein